MIETKVIWIENEERLLIVLLDDGNQIGLIRGRTDPTGSGQVYVGEVEIIPAFRGLGYGRLLYERFIDEAFAHGATSVSSYPGRSELATRVWQGLQRKSPYAIEHQEGYWVATRPVRVRAYRRQR